MFLLSLFNIETVSFSGIQHGLKGSLFPFQMFNIDNYIKYFYWGIHIWHIFLFQELKRQSISLFFSWGGGFSRNNFFLFSDHQQKICFLLLVFQHCLFLFTDMQHRVFFSCSKFLLPDWWGPSKNTCWSIEKMLWCNFLQEGPKLSWWLYI